MKINGPLIGLHLAVILLGMTGLFGKFLEISPLTIIAGRSFFTTIFLLFCLAYIKQSLAFESLANLFCLCLSGVVLSVHWLAFFHSIQISTVAIGVIGFATYPVFVTLLEPLFFKEGYRAMDVVSGAVVFLGLFLLSPEFSLNDTTTVALFWSVLSGLVLAFLTLINRKLIKKNHFMVVTCYQHMIAAVVTLPFVWAFSFWPSPLDFWMLMLLGVVFTAIPQTMLVHSLSYVKAQLASICVGLEPVYSIIFAIVLLGEIPDLRTLLGGVAVGVAVVIASRAHAVNTAT